jgi:hypothetical protein
VVCGAKSDPGDAHVIAEHLRLRAHHLRAATPLTEHTTALRTVTGTRWELIQARVAATNQLSALLEGLWPGAKEIVADLSSAISVGFLHRYPTPQHAATPGEKRMAAFLTKHGLLRAPRPSPAARSTAHRARRHQPAPPWVRRCATPLPR